MKRQTSALALFLALGMMVTTACGGSAAPADTTAPQNPDTTTAEVDDGFIDDELPELDFEGKPIRVLYREDVLNAFYVAEQTGDIVDDAVYKANSAVGW